MSFEPPKKLKKTLITHHNHILHTLTTCKIYQNNHVESKATLWPWKQLMGG
jgi:hypothetical protein